MPGMMGSMNANQDSGNGNNGNNNDNSNNNGNDNRDNFQEELAPIFNDMGGGPIPDFTSGTTPPPNDMPIFSDMMIDVRGDLQNSYKRGNQSQLWNIGDYDA